MDIAAAARALVGAAARDLETRVRLARSGALWTAAYHSEMEAVHVANASLLKSILAEHGWPDARRFGAEA